MALKKEAITGAVEKFEIMASASTYEQLLACWVDLKKELDTKYSEASSEYGTLVFHLQFIYRCFHKHSYECDTGVKQIFESEELLQMLEALKVPKTFLLQTVKIGALKGLLYRAEKSSDQPIKLYPDGTMSRIVSAEIRERRLSDPEKERGRLIEIIERIQSHPTLDGLSWANKQLEIIAREKKGVEQERKAEEVRKQEAAKASAIENARVHMRESDFRLSGAEANLLRPDLVGVLQHWRSILQGDIGKGWKDFVAEYGDQEITPEIFKKFSSLYQSQTEGVKRGDAELLLDIINPNSGLFYVLIVNQATTLNRFFQSLHANMDSWFVL